MAGKGRCRDFANEAGQRAGKKAAAGISQTKGISVMRRDEIWLSKGRTGKCLRPQTKPMVGRQRPLQGFCKRSRPAGRQRRLRGFRKRRGFGTAAGIILGCPQAAKQPARGTGNEAGRQAGQRRLQGFRKRRDFGTAAEINPGCPQAAKQPARLSTGNEAGRQVAGAKAAAGFRKRDFGTAAEINPGCPQAAKQPARLRPQTKPDGRQGKGGCGDFANEGISVLRRRLTRAVPKRQSNLRV